MRYLAILALLLAACPVSARTWYITPDGLGDAPTIQAGVDSAAVGDIIQLACGTYFDCTHPSADGELACVVLKSGITLRGQPGSADCVVIDAQELGRTIYCQNVDDTTRIEGLTVTNGLARVVGTGDLHSGSIHCDASSPMISECRFISNHALQSTGPQHMGGGLYCGSGSAPVIASCEFWDNTADTGGCIAFQGASPEIIDCSFSGNHARFGGAIYGQGQSSFATISSSIFDQNSATSRAGAIELYYGDNVAIMNCLFLDNSSSGGAGALRFFRGSPLVTGCTFAGNFSWNGGTVLCVSSSSPTFIGCTFYRNNVPSAGTFTLAGDGSLVPQLSIQNCTITDALNGNAISVFGGGTATLTCSNIFGNASGDWTGPIADQFGTDGNISANPIFCDADSDDLSLRSDSPCAPANSNGCGLIGALPVGCGPVAIKPESWGAIKAQYR